MKPTKAEIVFVIDSSESMRPCIDGLRHNLSSVIEPLQGHDIPTSMGLVALSAGDADGGGRLISVQTLKGPGVQCIYDGAPGLFTDSPQQFKRALESIQIEGDEHSLMALDMALDFPFGPVDSTRRVVCLFSDEKIEDGKMAPEDFEKIDEILKKAEARRVRIFGALPASPSLEKLAQYENAQFEPIAGGDGLRTVNFSKLLGQIGRTVSQSSVQGYERAYTKALFGQDSWATGSGSMAGR